MCKNYASNEQHARHYLSAIKCSIICNTAPGDHVSFVSEIQKIQTALERKAKYKK